MKVDDIRALIGRVLRTFSYSFAAVCLLAAPQTFAQDSSDAAAADDDEVEEVVVTGSRIKRDTYTSIAPLQVISGEVSREIGSIDPGTILQESTSAAGTQIDLSINGFVLDNGPGSKTIDLRGLGASRTLVLINGRRAAPAGVEGSPVSPDLNLVPSTLVQQYEILLDAASSIYGSDAIAGVSNIILRKDFDGLELEAYSSVPSSDSSAGIANTLSAAWGSTGDRGFFGIAAEYTESDPVTFDDRPWTSGCNKHMEIDENGSVRNEFLIYQLDYGMKTTDCKIGFGRRAWDNFNQFGSIYYTPGQSNIGIPNLSEATTWEIPLDMNQDGVPDVDFIDYNFNGSLGHGHMLPDHKRVSAMAYGEYTFSGEMNVTPYFELNWNERETYVYSPGATIRETVPANNPFNPCNPNGINGVDCLHAYDDLLDNPIFAAEFANGYGATPDFYAGVLGLTWLYNDYFDVLGPTATPLDARFSVKGDRDDVWSKVSQARMVAGIKGDLPQVDWGSMDNWTFDLALIHNDASGDSRRRGVNGENLLHSLATTVWDPASGSITCGNGSDGCVPVDLFAPALYEGLVDNDFATQAERDYLMANRVFDTKYKQSLFSAIATGDLFSLPGGDAAAAFGFEWRRDEIDSIPNDVARDGLLWGYFSDEGAIGDKETEEFFAEVELPLLANVPAFSELTVNVSTRHTKDEFYPGNWTYSGKLAWRPVDSLLIRATTGTSYRAPNMREVFLKGQSGFRNSTFDPCVVPEAALTLDGYDETRDLREPQVIDNCIADGVDPFTLGIISANQSQSVYSVEVFTAGQTELKEEQSESWTAGFAFEQPWAEAFDLTVGATYYDIEITDEITFLFLGDAIDDCYYDVEGDSTFCRFFERDLEGDGLISSGLEPFLNQESLNTRGVDVNLALDWPTQIFGKALDFSMDLSANRKLGFEQVFRDFQTGDIDKEDFVGEFGFPEWSAQGILRFDVGDWRLTWSSRYIGSVAQDPAGVDEFGNAIDGTADTCLGPDLDDVNCRDIGYAENYFRHDTSLYYRGDVWTIGGGMRNVFDEWPPQVDSSEVAFVYNNTPMGRGYDVLGRTLFLNVAASFE